MEIATVPAPPENRKLLGIAKELCEVTIEQNEELVKIIEQVYAGKMDRTQLLKYPEIVYYCLVLKQLTKEVL
ncbi:MAG: hypothetical protein CVU89_03435 [Firmicutes bacterium HGW-Firmicutes-14]|jgi:hypothetical protein|nr:MAG: hypothetical protein CVU89_03435 [Firmicutes bacterium HGW-Firmicutes-14]